MFDCIVIVDPRLRGAEERAFMTFLTTLMEAGYGAGLLPVLGPLAKRQAFMSGRIRQLCADQSIAFLDPPGPVSCHLLLGYHIDCFINPTDRLCPMDARHRLVRVDQPVVATDGQRLANVFALIANAAELMCGTPQLAPNDLIVRANLEALGLAESLTAQDWPPAVSNASNVRASESKGLFVLGRHDSDRPNAWPASLKGLAAMLAPGKTWTYELRGCGVWPEPIAGSRADIRTADPNCSPNEFLAGLDAYLTTVRHGLPPALDAALAEALAQGLPVIAPRKFRRILGDAGRFVDDDRWGEVYQKFDRQNLEAASAAARALGTHVQQDALRKRLAPFLEHRAAPSHQLVLRRDLRTRQRVLFVTPNGVGMGHLTRALSIARRLDPLIEPVFLTMSPGAAAIERFGFLTEYTPYHRNYRGDVEQWQRAFAAKLEQVIAFYDPRAVLFDGNVPYAGLIRVCEAHPERFFLWCRRGMWRPHADPRVADRGVVFDMIIEPEDLAKDYDRGATALRGDEAVEVGPIILLDRSEMAPRRLAREELGIPPKATAALIMLGAGNNFEMDQVCQVIVEALGYLPEIEIRIARWLISQNETQVRGVQIIEDYPLSRHFLAFDLAVSAAGYNSFHELLAAGVPAIFVPNENPTMDEQEARALWAERRGVGLCMRANDLFRLSWALRQLLDPGRRQIMQAKMSDLHVFDGGSTVANIIRDLVTSRKATVPGLNRPLTLPRGF